jgi:hypothetical protein
LSKEMVCTKSPMSLRGTLRSPAQQIVRLF